MNVSWCTSSLSSVFNELQDRHLFLEEMRNLGRASNYEAQIQSEISQTVREMEQIHNRECKKLLAEQLKPSTK